MSTLASGHPTITMSHKTPHQRIAGLPKLGVKVVKKVEFASKNFSLADHDLVPELKNHPLNSSFTLLEHRNFPNRRQRSVEDMGQGESTIRRQLTRSHSFDLKNSKQEEKNNTVKFEPLMKFRKAVKMVLHLLRATYTSRERTQRRERYFSIWSSYLDKSWTSSKRAYDLYGISFDPQDFKANREIQVTAEAKAILSLEPSRRTPPQLRQVLLSLRQAVKEFSEFPITMQESLVRVGWYEHFESKRVIIRQGHMADNFYFILSGTAIVIVLDTDKQTGEQTARTVAFLGKGKSFGELALMHKSRRSATVTCQSDVDLLAVGREDFVDIFMHVERGVEPEHIRFLRSLQILRDWPIEVLPVANPKILLFTYVRRGVLLCRDSNTSEWIYVVKSGSCSVIKALRAVHNGVFVDKSQATSINKPLVIQPTGSSLSPYSPLPSIGHQRGYTINISSDRRGRKKGAISLVLQERNKEEQNGLDHLQCLDVIMEQKHGAVVQQVSCWMSEFFPESPPMKPEDHQGEGMRNCVFVEILKLCPRDVYGLESCVFKSLNKTTSTNLVSGGAELIMINRKFFLDHTSEQLRKQIRREIRPLPHRRDPAVPSIETMASWEVFRNQILKKAVDSRKRRALDQMSG
ncbi:cyclic nucleotide-binding domain-containing protein 2-like, partial [Physella acuta]|uniref:cyclic nucleotide-binding domain-containing protein 2-like n=1 Tax=Physella acuta TaxID=109671 RepID=UPI0027DB792B